MDDKTQNPQEKFPPLKLKEVLEDGSEVTRTYYPLQCRYVPDEFKDYAEKVLNETPENMAKGTEMLKKLLEKRKEPEMSEDTLRLILRSCKYDLKKLESKLNNYLKTRSMLCERFANMDMEVLEKVLDDNCIGILPYRDKEGQAIVYHQFNNLSLKGYEMNDSAFLFFAFLLYMLEFPLTSLTGLAHIAEWRPPPLAAIYELIKYIRLHTKMWLSLPIRIRRVDGINEIAIIRWMITMLKPLMPSKIYSRIVFYGQDMNKLYAAYHPDILPKEFGGYMGPIDTSFYREDFINFVKSLATEHRAKQGNEQSLENAK